MALSAAKYDQRIEILRLDTAVANALGETVPSYSVFYTCWAARNFMGREERLAAQAVGATQTMKFTVRYCRAAMSITPLDRVRWKGKTYNISSAEEYGRAEDVILWVEGLVA